MNIRFSLAVALALTPMILLGLAATVQAFIH